MKAAQMWPLAIVGVLAITVGANLYLLYEARDGNGAATEPDYYAKAVAWDSTMAQSRTDAALGWKLSATLGDVGAEPAAITLHLADANGAPIDDARITVEAIHNLDAAHYVHAALTSQGAGAYVSGAVLPRAGRWELRFTAHRGAQLFTGMVHADAAKSPR